MVNAFKQLFDRLFECSLNLPLGLPPAVDGGLVVQLSQDMTQLRGEHVFPGGRPLTPFDESSPPVSDAPKEKVVGS